MILYRCTSDIHQYTCIYTCRLHPCKPTSNIQTHKKCFFICDSPTRVNASSHCLGMNKVVGLTRTGEGMLSMYVGMTRHDRAWHCVLQPTDNTRLLLIVMSCHLVDKTLTCKRHVRLICPRSYRYEL